IERVLHGLDGSGEAGLATAMTILASLGPAGAEALAARREFADWSPAKRRFRSGDGRASLRRRALGEALARAGGPAAAAALSRARDSASDEDERRWLDELVARARRPSAPESFA